MNLRIIIFMTAFVGAGLCSAGKTFGAEILLKNGHSGKGEILELSDATVKVDLGGIEVVYPLENIKSVNGILDLSRSKLSEMAKLAHELTVSAKYAEALPILDQLEAWALLADLDIEADYAEVLDGLGAYEKAIVYFRKALEKGSRGWLFWQKFAHALRYGSKNLNATLEAYEKSFSLQEAEIHQVLVNHNAFEMGSTYAEFGDWQRSIPYLEKAVLGPPTSAGVPSYFFNFLIKGYVSVAEPEKAISVGQKALGMYPESEMGPISHYLGLAFQALGQSEKAALCERKAKELGY